MSEKIEERLDHDVTIRQVSVLKGRARKKAEEMDLNEEDLVIVRTHISEEDPLPTYELEKIEGDPVSYMLEEVDERE